MEANRLVNDLDVHADVLGSLVCSASLPRYFILMQKKVRKPKDDSWFVYILRCADSSLYTGINKDVNRRCQQHNAGTASRYTRSRRPVKLVCQQVQPSQSAALKREAAIKAMTRKEKLAMIRSRKKAG
jgi:predicted GIY-YIG superfamily endonuclease